MNIAAQRDIGSLIKGQFALIPNVVTAGGAGDGVEQDGAWIDVTGYLSAKLVIVYSTTLTESETLTIAANLQDASDSSGTGAADFGDAYAAAIVATGGAGGSTETGVVEIDVNLSSGNGFARCQVTPTLSAGATDTAAIAAALVCGGGDTYPLA